MQKKLLLREWKQITPEILVNPEANNKIIKHGPIIFNAFFVWYTLWVYFIDFPLSFSLLILLLSVRMDFMAIFVVPWIAIATESLSLSFSRSLARSRKIWFRKFHLKNFITNTENYYSNTFFSFNVSYSFLWASTTLDCMIELYVAPAKLRKRESSHFDINKHFD
jgi:hypothetical protein